MGLLLERLLRLSSATPSGAQRLQPDPDAFLQLLVSLADTEGGSRKVTEPPCPSLQSLQAQGS